MGGNRDGATRACTQPAGSVSAAGARGMSITPRQPLTPLHIDHPPRNLAQLTQQIY